MITRQTIRSNSKIAQDTYQMEFTWTPQQGGSPGQFVQIRVPGFYLRRPISICENKEDSLVIIYKTVGEGTEALSRMQEGDTLDIFGPLGHGFDLSSAKEVTLIGGGVGVPPLYELAKQYRRQETEVHVVLGFNTKEQMFYQDHFEELGCDVNVATMDGSCGIKGTVLDCIRENGISMEYVQCCGPLPMLKAVKEEAANGQISLESRMACGMGACMGCVIQDENEQSYRICKDGPVFDLEKGIVL